MYSREELKILRSEFWEMFGQRCEVHPELRERKKKWVLHRTKIRDVALKFEIGREDAKVMIEVSHKNENKRLQVFEILEKYKAILELGFDDDLTWDFVHEREDSQKEVCRIYTNLEGVDFHRKNDWPEIFNFFIDKMLILERIFMEIRDILLDEIIKSE
ncbi:MAG: DUF4268 domain-containing protein [Prolixibacteraceae bacterium]|nr:DUF4268 domain-containing protein [Prolixibacteraceae bacterium]MBN2774617.1 DUF4268 domain-containing protein [Prolixibacteraceae bacterium]